MSRLPKTIMLLVIAIHSAKAADDAVSPDSKLEKARAATGGELAKKEADLYRIEPDGVAKGPLTLQPKAILQWSNPVAGSIYGSAFVWTERGRPAVVSSIYKWFSPETHLGVEFHSLVPGLLTAVRDGRPAWAPQRPGLELKPIPEAPAPAETPAARLRQIRSLAKDFAAGETTRTDVRRELRLLTQPLYRYESTDPEVIDGGLFAFVEGTDPEVILLIEARRTPKGPEWMFGAVRMNSVDLRLSFKGREVWTAPVIPWEQARSNREPYFLSMFDLPPVPGDVKQGKESP